MWLVLFGVEADHSSMRQTNPGPGVGMAQRLHNHGFGSDQLRLFLLAQRHLVNLYARILLEAIHQDKHPPKLARRDTSRL